MGVRDAGNLAFSSDANDPGTGMAAAAFLVLGVAGVFLVQYLRMTGCRDDAFGVGLVAGVAIIAALSVLLRP